MNPSLLSLLTRPVVRRELVRDKAIQECIDLVRDSQSEPCDAIEIAGTHRIYPIGAHL